MRIVLAVLMVFSFSAHADYFQDNDGGLYYLDHADVLNGWASHLPSGAVSITDAQAATVQASQAASAAAAAALLPNPQGFIAAVKSVFGGPVAILSLPPTVQNAITLCIAAINEGNWADVQAIIISQQAALNAANIAIYPAIKAAAASNNIPITL